MVHVNDSWLAFLVWLDREQDRHQIELYCLGVANSKCLEEGWCLALLFYDMKYQEKLRIIVAKGAVEAR
jgi:hypothetical protein